MLKKCWQSKDTMMLDLSQQFSKENNVSRYVFIQSQENRWTAFQNYMFNTLLKTTSNSSCGGWLTWWHEITLSWCYTDSFYSNHILHFLNNSYDWLEIVRLTTLLEHSWRWDYLNALASRDVWIIIQPFFRRLEPKSGSSEQEEEEEEEEYEEGENEVKEEKQWWHHGEKPKKQGTCGESDTR